MSVSFTSLSKTSDKQHFYKTNEKYGHAVLAKLCAEFFDNVLKSTQLDLLKPTDAQMYTFENGFYHMVKDEANINSYVNSYLENSELICHCAISVETLGSWQYNLRNVISKSQCKGKFNELEGITVNPNMSDETYYAASFRHSDRLQRLITEVPGSISFKAMELHARYFPNKPYFEKVSEHDEKNVKAKTIVLFSREEERSHAEAKSELCTACSSAYFNRTIQGNMEENLSEGRDLV